MPKCLDHIVLNVEDMDAMMAFYTGPLGLRPERLEAFRAGQVPFPSVRIHENTIIDFFPKEMWAKTETAAKGQPNLNHFCIALDKELWEHLRHRLDQENVTVLEGPVERWGAHGTGISIYFRDPDGNLIEARYYEG